MNFKDHFSKQADDYARYRPVYPSALFDYLASLAARHELAWDAGTGNGQAAVALAVHFERVSATDPSAAQIQNAVAHDRIVYKVAPAERTELAAGSVDLITVAQALHWFDLGHFYREVHRVLKPAGILAVWCYGLSEIAPGIDEIVHHYYDGIVGPYWPPERHFIEARYQTLSFPFAEQSAPVFAMEAHWDKDEFAGYLGTWSATRRYVQEQQRDPRELIADSLRTAWGPPPSKRTVRWPIYLRVGRIPV
jgi:SAM-dependent methyltransferase